MLLRLNDRAAAIDTAARTVTTAGGETLHYDKLVLATGSYPSCRRCPARTAATASSTAPSKTGSDAGPRRPRPLRRGDRRRPARPRMRQALRDMGLQTHVVEFAPRLMAVQVDDGGGRMLRQKIEALGVTVHTGKNTLEIVDGEHGTHRMRFADGSQLDTDMIVFSAGIRPRDELARAAGLRVGERGGIAIDDQCLTSTRMSTPSANAHCGRARYSAGRAGLRHGARGGAPAARRGGVVRRGRPEHQAQADGRGRGQHRRPARPCRAAAPTTSPTSASRSTRSWSCPSAAGTCWAACWSATRPSTAPCCR